MMGERAEGYMTKQREAVIAHLRNNVGAHITAAMTHESLRKSGMAIGLATVYRILDSLAKSGDVMVYKPDGAAGACYQYTGCDAGHLHLKCGGCGGVEHIECGQVDDLRGHFLQEHGFDLDTARTLFVGKCASCASRGK